MKKIILTTTLILLANISLAQWTSRNVDNGFDPAYHICYTKESNNSVLKLENVDGEIALYLQGGYFCSDVTEVDISFMVNGVWKKYTTTATKSSDSKLLFLIDDMTTSDALIDFLNATLVKLRVNEEYCETEYYQFNMSGSTAAYKFIKN